MSDFKPEQEDIPEQVYPKVEPTILIGFTREEVDILKEMVSTRIILLDEEARFITFSKDFDIIQNLWSKLSGK